MGIEDINISEELETSAAPIKYRGDEGPKSPQDEQRMKMAQLEEAYEQYVDEMIEMGNEPMSMEQFLQQVMAEGQMAGGQPLPNDPTDPVNPFQPKPTGPPLPDRQMAAYGGIMGLDGRKKYGIGSWFQENIMDPIKNNPLIAAAALAGGVDLYKRGDESVIGNIFNNPAVERILKGKEILDKDKKGTGKYEGGVYDALAKNIVPIIGGIGAGIFTKSQQGGGGGGQNSNTFGQVNDQTAMNLKEYTQGINLLDAKGMAAVGQNFALPDAARKYTPTEMIETYAQAAANGGRIGFNGGGGVGSMRERLIAKGYDWINDQTDDEVVRQIFDSEMGTFTDSSVYRANGGRIGFDNGGGADMGAPQMNRAQVTEEAITKIMQKMQDPNLTDEDRAFLQAKLQAFGMPQQKMPMMGMEQMSMMARGGRIGRAEGGIMDLGGMEKDYRAEGGFVPIGAKEKADDVPARLSVNEFVFTADAVRNAGGGDIDQGAQVMENMMKNLEQGGQVSEESQGMQGARDMFATSERLGEVI